MDISGHDLSLGQANVKRIGRRVHENERISGDAARLMAYFLENEAEDMWRAASEAAEHAGRKTVQEGDIRVAMSMRGRFK